MKCADKTDEDNVVTCHPLRRVWIEMIDESNNDKVSIVSPSAEGVD